MDALHLLGANDDGVFTTSMASTMGLGAQALHDLVQQGKIEHLGRALYAVPGPDLSPEQAHLRLAKGGRLIYPDAVLGHVAAVIAHGLPVHGPDLRRATIHRPVTKEVLTQSFRIRPLGSLPVVKTAAGPAVELPHVLVRYTLEAGILAGVVAADHALHAKRLTHDELSSVAETVAGWPRFGQVRSMLSLADGRSESPGESILRVQMHAAGIALVPQVTITEPDGSFVARVDFVVANTKVVVEFDGKAKYREGGADALWAEKKREDRIRRLGFVVVRVTWADLHHPHRVAAMIRTALVAA